MKAITIHAPWAWAILAGHKRWENRTWGYYGRGWLAIHAGASKASDAAAETLFDPLGLDYPDDWTPYRGKLLGVVWCGGCEEGALEGDPFATGPYRLALSDARELAEPIAMAGKLSLWNLPADVLERVERELGPLGEIQDQRRGPRLF